MCVVFFSCVRVWLYFYFIFAAAGKSWTDYNDPTFEPVFFNPDLTVMFPDSSMRETAISTCNGGAATDDSPEDRRECYFDFLVIIKVWKPSIVVLVKLVVFDL